MISSKKGLQKRGKLNNLHNLQNIDFNILDNLAILFSNFEIRGWNHCK